MEKKDQELIPVTIITGFLGSGKTTLLNYILKQQEGLKIALLVNEFGDIGIDNELIVSTEDNVVELNNGCICCTINQDLIESVNKILQRDKQVDYLIVETTGVADPLPVAMTFVASTLKAKTRLDSIVTLADCENFSLDRFPDNETAVNQFVCADVVILNKTDLVDSNKIANIEGRIDDLKQGVRIIKTTNSQVSLPLILSVGLFESDRYYQEDQEKKQDHDHKHDHSHEQNHDHNHDHDHSHHLENDGFTSVSFECNQPLSIRKFQYFLDNQLPKEVFRGKGFLWFEDSEFKHIFHLSGTRFTIDDQKWQTPPQNQLVFIGQNLKSEELKPLLQECVVS